MSSYVPAALRRLVIARAEGCCEFHPRRQEWPAHFRMEGALIVPLTPEGRVTVKILRFNDPDRLAERELLVAAGLYH